MKHFKKATRLSMALSVTGLAFAFMLITGTHDVGAYSGAVTNCIGCHSIWASGGGSGHTSHTAYVSCTGCHLSVGDTPASSKCGQCHLIPGVAAHHSGTGASNCTGCHSGAAAPENSTLPGYAGTTLNPCTDGLDNDGNLKTDGADSACGTTPVDPGTSGVPSDHVVAIGGVTHKAGQSDPITNGCTSCHGATLQGGSGSSCYTCHSKLWTEPQTTGLPADHTSLLRGAAHKSGLATPYTSGCTACHGATLTGGTASSCFKCHGQMWTESGTGGGTGGGTTGGTPSDHTISESGEMHKSGYNTPFTNGCTSCHGADLRGGTGPSCYSCHGVEWSGSSTGGGTTGTPSDHTISEDGERHKPGYNTPYSSGCTSCHGATLTGGIASSCYKCHGVEWSGSSTGGGTTGGTPSDHTISESGQMHKSGYNTPFTNGCTSCHGADLRGGTGPSCYSCHGVEWSGSSTGGTTTGGTPSDHTISEDGHRHKSGYNTPFTSGCTSCHGANLTGGIASSCYKCHGVEWSTSSTSYGEHDSEHDGERHH